jgi:hypothetical protein
MTQTVTFSDTHMFAPYSEADRYLADLEAKLDQLKNSKDPDKHCVLNGDIFEFLECAIDSKESTAKSAKVS